MTGRAEGEFKVFLYMGLALIPITIFFMIEDFTLSVTLIGMTMLFVIIGLVDIYQ